jgi:hypothetical protein
MKEINFCCLRCGDGILLHEPFPPTSRCTSCQQELALSLEKLAPLQQCAVCHGEDFYLQKDFNRSLGLFLVLLGASLSFLFFSLGFPLLYFWLPLLILPLLDFLLYFLCPLILICYRCEGIYRHFETSLPVEGFDLGHSSQLKIRRPPFPPSS